MRAMFRSGYRRRLERGLSARARFWVTIFADLLVTATAERFVGARDVRRAGGNVPGAAREGRIDGPRLRFPWLPRPGSVRHAARRQWAAPVRTVLLSTTLGLGIGAALIMIVLVEGVLLRPLPFHQPDRLVRLLEVDESGRTWWPSYLNFADWRRNNEAFDGLVAMASPSVLPVLYEDGAVRLPVGSVSRRFFSVLGVPLARGREGGDDENAPGGAAVAVVSWSFWSNQLGAKPLEELAITVGGEQYRVAGVTEPGFRFLGAGGLWSEADVWLPLDRRDDPGNRRSHGYHVVGRLAEGTDLGAARSRMDDLAARLRMALEESTHAFTVRLDPLQEVVVGRTREPLTVLSWGAMLVLFVAGFNLAGALLVAGIGRRDELAVRRALGATRGDVAAHLLVESSLLAVPAAAIGVGLAAAGLGILRMAPPEAVARIGSVGLTGKAVVLAVAVALSSALAGGVVPAVTLSATGGGRRGRSRSTGGRGESLAWRTFITVQVALTMVLLIAGALLARSFNAARLVDLGYETDAVLAVGLSLPASRYAEPSSRVAFFDRILSELEARPDVEAVGISNMLPQQTQARIGGAARPENTETWMFAGLRAVNDGYFDALRIPRLATGTMNEADAFVVDRSVGDVLFDGDNPVGETLASSLLDEPRRITGWVGAVREWDLPMDAVGTIYVDYREHPGLLLDAYLLVRTGADPEVLAASIREALGRVDPMVPVQVDLLADLVGEELAGRRLVLGIAVAFGLVTLCLAAVGVYSVVAFVTRRRDREVAVRMVLGARPAQLRRAMLGYGLRPALLGLLLGAAAAWPAARLLESQLFGVAPYDPVAVAGALATLALVAFAAAYVPSRAATRKDPMSTLRRS